MLVNLAYEVESLLFVRLVHNGEPAVELVGESFGMLRKLLVALKGELVSVNEIELVIQEEVSGQDAQDALELID